jgi:UDP-glucose 4-epimerase
VLDNVSTGAWEHVPMDEIHSWTMDIREKRARREIELCRFDAIVHLAAQTMVYASLKDPYFDADENLMGTVNILEAARKSGVKRVVLASTAAVYGDVAQSRLPLVEETPLLPLSFYGFTKLAAEHYLSLYKRNYGLDYVALRFANVYGERQGDKGEGGVISIFAKRIAEGEGITIFGDGEQTRDFIYAGDVAAGILAALHTENVNTEYNLATQTETSLNQLVQLFAQVSGKDCTPRYGEARQGDIRRSMLSNEKAKAGLGWEPKVSLKDGLANTYEYFATK